MDLVFEKLCLWIPLINSGRDWKRQRKFCSSKVFRCLFVRNSLKSSLRRRRGGRTEPVFMVLPWIHGFRRLFLIFWLWQYFSDFVNRLYQNNPYFSDPWPVFLWFCLRPAALESSPGFPAEPKVYIGPTHFPVSRLVGVSNFTQVKATHFTVSWCQTLDCC